MSKVDRAPRFALLDTSFSSISVIQVLDSFNIGAKFVGARAGDYVARVRPLDWLELDYSKPNELTAITDNGYRTLPGTNDDSLRAHCLTSVGSSSIAELVHILDKEHFAALAQEVGFLVPWFTVSDQIVERGVGGNIVVKPLDSFGGNGQTVLSPMASSAEYVAAWQLARRWSKSKRVMVQEFVEGQLFSLSAFLVDGFVQDAFLVDEWVDEYWKVHLSYVRHDEAIKPETISRIEILAGNLGVRTLLLHIQGIRTEDGKEYLLEATSRHPGDLYGNLILASTGFNYSQAYLSSFLDDIPYPSGRSTEKWILRQTVRAPFDGTFHDLTASENSMVTDVYLERELDTYLNKGDRIGVAFSSFEDGPLLRAPSKFVEPSLTRS